MKVSQTTDRIIRIACIVIILAGCALGAVLLDLHNKEISNKKYCWRGHSWETPLNDSFVYIRDYSYLLKVYSFKNEKMCIGTEPLDSVRYTFYKNTLYSVFIYLNKSVNKDKIDEYYCIKYGAPSKKCTQETSWDKQIYFTKYSMTNKLIIIKYVNNDVGKKIEECLTQDKKKKEEKENRAKLEKEKKEIEACGI